MTIKEFIESYQSMDDKYKSPNGSKLSETMAKCTSVWSNDACRGYLIATAKCLNMSVKDIKALLKAVNEQFSYYSIVEAEKIYFNF